MDGLPLFRGCLLPRVVFDALSQLKAGIRPASPTPVSRETGASRREERGSAAGRIPAAAASPCDMSRREVRHD